MEYKIILDSCGELPENLLHDGRFERVPLSLEVGDYKIQDDENFNQAEFLRKVAAYPECPKSACPSPERFVESFRAPAADRIYVVTLSAALSGTYNSAELARKLFREKYGEKQIHVIDSQSASGGETQIALKLADLEEEGIAFEEIVKQIESYRDSIHTYFVLDNLETLRKNGRMSGVKAFVASALNIKPVMGSDTGEIILRTQTIGVNKALGKMAQLAAQEAPRPQERRLIITHCNAPDRAEQVKKQIMARAPFQECIIMDTRGVSSMYANDGGVIVTT
ncbi:MAG: DegV family protein [Lachnospiraceae bacterium]|jgi:DegV family protein with EDD domain|nr:DegV family protein [Lachnospiraceae bacterium]